MSLLDDTIFQGPNGLIKYISGQSDNIPRIKKLEIHTLKNNGREDRFYLYAWGSTTNHRTRTILHVNPLEILQASSNDKAIELITQSIEQAIPILETALRLAGEP